MNSFLISILLVVVLFLAGVVLIKMLLPPKESDSTGVKIRKTGEQAKVEVRFQEPAPATLETPLYDEIPRETRQKRSANSIMPLIFLTVIGYVVYANQDLIKTKLPVVSNKSIENKKSERQALSLAEVEGHTVVEGINWIKIVATGTDGVPFEGWVSELAIQKEPPKENREADEFMKKVGLQTNKERLQNIKHIRKVNEALDTALKDFRRKED